MWYMGPMFRHERPQKGRYRQFHQFGVELFGINGPDIDAELIMLTHRLWRLFGETENVGDGGEDLGLARKLHQAIAGVGADIEALGFNKAVAKIHALANDIEKAKPSATRAEASLTLIRLVAPMMPHLAEEAWAALPAGQRATTLIADAAWPIADPALLIDDEVTIAIQIAGKPKAGSLVVVPFKVPATRPGLMARN